MGQIKNIKLHIVTDIKILLHMWTKMTQIKREPEDPGFESGAKTSDDVDTQVKSEPYDPYAEIDTATKVAYYGADVKVKRESDDSQNEHEAQPAAKKQRFAPGAKQPRIDLRLCEQDDVVVLSEKVFIPVEKYPQYNFVGSIIGPSGSILKELTKATKSKIAILGRGSLRDKAKEELLLTSDAEEDAHLKEPLHVLIDIKAPRADAHLRMHIALHEIYKFMIPPDVKEQQFGRGAMEGGFRGPGGPRGSIRGRPGGGGPRVGFGPH